MSTEVLARMMGNAAKPARIFILMEVISKRLNTFSQAEPKWFHIKNIEKEHRVIYFCFTLYTGFICLMCTKFLVHFRRPYDLN